MKLWQLSAATILAATASLAFAGTFSVDPVHSTAVFRIKHMDTSYFHGRINKPEGSVSYDPAKPESSSFEITLKADNIDTDNKMRDGDLKSAKYFNAKEFQTLSFKSTSVKPGSDANHLEVTGDLTIHGVTKPVTVTIEHTGDGTMQGKQIIGFETTFNVKRTDFGMKETPGLSDDVRITVALEADKK